MESKDFVSRSSAYDLLRDLASDWDVGGSEQLLGGSGEALLVGLGMLSLWAEGKTVRSDAMMFADRSGAERGSPEDLCCRLFADGTWGPERVDWVCWVTRCEKAGPPSREAQSFGLSAFVRLPRSLGRAVLDPGCLECEMVPERKWRAAMLLLGAGGRPFRSCKGEEGRCTKSFISLAA